MNDVRQAKEIAQRQIEQAKPHIEAALNGLATALEVDPHDECPDLADNLTDDEIDAIYLFNNLQQVHMFLYEPSG